MLAIVAPGQGAQTPGFLAPWMELSTFAERLEMASDVAGLDLITLGTSADAETIRDTKVAQPLLVAAALLTASELSARDDVPFAPADMAAGHSVGEIAAAAGAGVLSMKDAMRLVSVRGRAMADAAAQTPTTMAAVIGGNPDEVVAAIEAVGATPANYNGSGQIVAAGTVDQIKQLSDNPLPRTRVIGLSVAGAFHTKHMQPAVSTLQDAAKTITVENPTISLLTNHDGSIVRSGSKYLDLIVHQVVHPVRWDLCMDTMRSASVTGLIELAPAGTLTGIAKRNLKGVELFNLNTPDQLDDAAEFVARHAGRKALEEQ